MRRLWLPRVLVSMILVVSAVTFLPPARGLTWVQTSETDFLAGTATNTSVTTAGDVELAATSSWWVREGVVLDLGPPAAFDASGVRNPFVLKNGTEYHMWYTGFGGGRVRILHANSTDGVTWNRLGVAIPILTPPYNFDGSIGVTVTRENGTYKMWFSGVFWTGGPFGTGYARIYYATSMDAVSWNIVGTALGLGPVGSWDDLQVVYPAVIRDTSGLYWMYYQGYDAVPRARIGVATSATGLTFVRGGVDPVLPLGPTGSWDDAQLFTPGVLPSSPRQIWYAGSDGGIGRLGVATTMDGFNLTKAPDNPRFLEGTPGSWDDSGMFGPAFLADGADTFLYYTGSDGAIYRIGRARQEPLYATAGVFDSAMLDTGSPGSTFATLSANATLPNETALLLRTRSGDVPTPDTSWSPWSAPVPPGTSPVSSPRARYLQVRAELSTANATVTPALHEFSVDYAMDGAAPPTPVAPPDGSWVNTSSLLSSWLYIDPEGDPAAWFHVQVSASPTFSTVAADSGAVLSAADAWRSPPLADGDWYWRVQTADAFGAWSAWSTVSLARIDTTPPTSTPSLNALAGTVDGVPWLDTSSTTVLTATDTASGVVLTEYTINGGPAQAYIGPFLPPDHGLIDLAFRSTDAAGNVETWRTTTLLLDAAPSVAPFSPPNGTWGNTSSLALQWTFADPDSDPQGSFRVQVSASPAFTAAAADSGAVLSAADTWRSPALADGDWYWRVQAADSFGVWSPWSNAAVARIDTAPPTTTATFTATAGTVDGILWLDSASAVVLSTSDARSGVVLTEYTINGGPAQVYANPFLPPGHGLVDIAFRSSDAAGNVEAWGATRVLRDAAPSVAADSPADGVWVNTPAVTVAWTLTDPEGDAGSAYVTEVSTDPSFTTIAYTSGTIEGATASHAFPGLPDGTYYWRVRAADAFGVWSPFSGARSFSVDRTPAEVEARYRGAAVTGNLLSLLTGESVDLAATDASSGVARVEYALNGGAWQNYSGPVAFSEAGQHTFAFRAVDTAGNVGGVKEITIQASGRWTPLVALLLAVLLALSGALVARRVGGLPPSPSKGAVWVLLAGPPVGLEAAVGLYALVTGELPMPPWFGTALYALLAIAIAGWVLQAAGSRMLSRGGHPASGTTIPPSTDSEPEPSEIQAPPPELIPPPPKG